MAQQPDGTVSSTGQVFAAGGWLDAHFEMARPEYAAMARAAGFRSGWRVLDAGCGGGHYLPLLAALVGPAGALAALDRAPEHIAAVRERVAAGAFACPVAAAVGSVLALPYPDGAFDGLWCAAVTQYLADGELTAALAEFRRTSATSGHACARSGTCSSTTRTTTTARGTSWRSGECRPARSVGHSRGHDLPPRQTAPRAFRPQGPGAGAAKLVARRRQSGGRGAQWARAMASMLPPGGRAGGTR